MTTRHRQLNIVIQRVQTDTGNPFDPFNAGQPTETVSRVWARREDSPVRNEVQGDRDELVAVNEPLHRPAVAIPALGHRGFHRGRGRAPPPGDGRLADAAARGDGRAHGGAVGGRIRRDVMVEVIIQSQMDEGNQRNLCPEHASRKHGGTIEASWRELTMTCRCQEVERFRPVRTVTVRSRARAVLDRQLCDGIGANDLP